MRLVTSVAARSLEVVLVAAPVVLVELVDGCDCCDVLSDAMVVLVVGCWLVDWALVVSVLVLREASVLPVAATEPVAEAPSVPVAEVVSVELRAPVVGCCCEDVVSVAATEVLRSVLLEVVSVEVEVDGEVDAVVLLELGCCVEASVEAAAPVLVELLLGAGVVP
jgi:hypothetical protein